MKRALLAIVLASLGCGGALAVVPDDGGEDATTDSAADPFSGDTSPPVAWDGDCPPPCPGGMPTVGSSCAGRGTCEYEGDAGCSRFVECANGAWKLGGEDCTWPPAVACPASPQDAMDASCNAYGKRCDYPDASCGCPVEAGAVWQCWPKHVGCPAHPRIGAPCTSSPPSQCTDPLVRCNPTVYACGCGQWGTLSFGKPPAPCN